VSRQSTGVQPPSGNLHGDVGLEFGSSFTLTALGSDDVARLDADAVTVVRRVEEDPRFRSPIGHWRQLVVRC
jgi:hypothetical protein